MDRAAFASDAFDVKDWLNRVCRSVPADEDICKYLAELEMKAQLAAEDVEQQLFDTSALLVSRVGGVQSAFGSLQNDLQQVASQIQALDEQVNEQEAQFSGATTRLTEIDRVKQRVIQTRSALQEASTLKELYSTLDEVMGSTDTEKMFKVYSTMKYSMDAVAQFPEFVGVGEKLTLLESRLKELAMPRLTEAIGQQDADGAQLQWRILTGIEKADLAQEVYVQHLCLQMQEAFEHVSSRQVSITQWLPQWHSTMLGLVAHQQDWLSSALPEQQEALFLQALSVALKAFVGPIREKLVALDGTTVSKLLALTTCIQTTSDCCGKLAARFQGTPPSIIASLTHPLFTPFEMFMAQYADMEALVLSEEAKEGHIVVSKDRSPEETTEVLMSSPGELQRLALAAIERCQHFTAGLQLPELFPALDRALGRCIHDATRKVKSLAEQLSGAGGQKSNPELHSGTHLLLTLPLAVEAMRECVVSVDTELRGRAAALEPLAAATKSGASEKLEAAMQGCVAAGMANAVAWRLGNVTEARKLSGLIDAVQGMLLPAAFAALEKYDSDVSETVLHMLCQPADNALQEMAAMTIWAASGNAQEMNSYSAYPSTQANNIAELLITLPPQLEVLVGDEGRRRSSLGNDDLASQWLDKVASNIAEKLSSLVMSIQSLGSKGSLQLSADLEYVCNVLRTLGIELPRPLATACVLSATPDEVVFRELSKQGIEDESLDRQACERLARMRGFDLNFTQE